MLPQLLQKPRRAPVDDAYHFSRLSPRKQSDARAVRADPGYDAGSVSTAAHRAMTVGAPFRRWRHFEANALAKAAAGEFFGRGLVHGGPIMPQPEQFLLHFVAFGPW